MLLKKKKEKEKKRIYPAGNAGMEDPSTIRCVEPSRRALYRHSGRATFLKGFSLMFLGRLPCLQAILPLLHPNP
jgi:hypothetical protein